MILWVHTFSFSIWLIISYENSFLDSNSQAKTRYIYCWTNLNIFYISQMNCSLSLMDLSWSCWCIKGFPPDQEASDPWRMSVCVVQTAQYKVRPVQCKVQPILPHNQRSGIKQNMPWVPVSFWNPVHWVSCTIHIRRVTEESLGTVLTLPSEVLAKLRSLDPQVQPSLWCWDHFWVLVTSEFLYVILFFPKNRHVEVSPEERIALSHHHHRFLVVRREED